MVDGGHDATPAAAPASQRPTFAELASLSPAYFGLVMATGIVSLAAFLLGYSALAWALFWLNLVAYAVLWGLAVLRAVLYPRRFFGDMVDHSRGPGFFTTVAATGVLGNQTVLLATDYGSAMALWVVAIVLWILLTYTIFTGITVKAVKPSLREGINGAWLLAVVATQSIAVLGALLAPGLDPAYRLEMNFLALSMWLWGGMLYIWMMSLIFYRYAFFPFSPGDLTPPYWINMGAMAISTLAGSLLIVNINDAPFLASLLPFIKGFTVFYWATGTWWIPMLVILGVWRHVVKRFPLKYDPLYWGIVFPLGMYAAGTHELVLAMRFDFLQWLPQVFFWIALAAWTAAFTGLARDLVRRAGNLRVRRAGAARS